MTINQRIITALTPLNVPVSFQEGLSDVYPHITFFNYLEQGEGYADNDETETGYYIQVDIWSKDDYTDLVQQVIDALKNAGFKRDSAVDLYEMDTKIYHKAIRVFYLEEN